MTGLFEEVTIVYRLYALQCRKLRGSMFITGHVRALMHTRVFMVLPSNHNVFPRSLYDGS